VITVTRATRMSVCFLKKNAWLFQAKRLNNSNSIPKKLLALHRWWLGQIALLPINGDLVFHDLSDNHFQIAAIISIDKWSRAFNDFLQAFLNQGGQLETTTEFFHNLIA